MIKKILSALGVLTLFAGSLVGAFFLYQNAFNEEPTHRELNPEEAAEEISMRLGEPFVKAWAARDVEAIKLLVPGEFGGGMATLIEWTDESNPPFETKRRSCTEEQQDSTTEFDAFFGCLLDPIAGLEIVQTEFSVLDAYYYGRKNDDMYHCRVLLTAIGFDENDEIRTFRSEQDLLVRLPVFSSIVPPSFRSWGIREETIRESTEGVTDQINELLSKRGFKISAQSDGSMDLADLDGDNDLDIAITFEGGQRFVFVFGDNKYQDATETLGITSDEVQADGSTSTRTVWLDYNGDGFPDLISGGRMFENKNGKTLVDVTEQVGLKTLMGPSGDSMGLLRRHFLSNE